MVSGKIRGICFEKNEIIKIIIEVDKSKVLKANDFYYLVGVSCSSVGAAPNIVAIPLEYVNEQFIFYLEMKSVTQKEIWGSLLDKSISIIFTGKQPIKKEGDTTVTEEEYSNIEILSNER